MLFRALSGSFIRPVLLSTHVSSQDQKSVCGLPKLLVPTASKTLHSSLSPVESDPGEMGAERVLAENFNAVTVCGNGMCVFFPASTSRSPTDFYVH